MKVQKFASLVVFGLVLAVAVVGCRKRPGYLTPLPGSTPSKLADAGPGAALTSAPATTDSTPVSAEQFTGTPQPGIDRSNWNQNRAMFEAQTVYFAFDSSELRAGERAKIATVADYLKANTVPAMRVEGHCDERGTEEYNRSLGDRRAQAIREELIRLGVPADRVETVSFGEDRPKAMGHDEEAWRQNRRGEFVVLTPP